MNAVITVNLPNSVEIQDSDLIVALQNIVKNECKKLNEHFSKKTILSSRAFAHTTHNLAHAQMALLYS